MNDILCKRPLAVSPSAHGLLHANTAVEEEVEAAEREGLLMSQSAQPKAKPR